MQHVTAGAHLPIFWLFEPTKRPDDRADHCLDSSFLQLGQKRLGLDPVGILCELSHLAVPINFLAQGDNQLAQASFESGTSGARVEHSVVAPHWLSFNRRPWEK